MNQQKKKFPHTMLHTKSGGFTLLLAVLIASIVLAISLSVFGIVVREISISTSARESRLAFYASDSGIDCALYWDFTANAFATNTPAATTIACNGQSFDVGGWDSCTPTVCSSSEDEKEGLTTFTMNLDNGSCAFEVEVKKLCQGPNGEACLDTVDKKTIVTEVRSRGHNTCADGFVVERGILVTY